MFCKDVKKWLIKHQPTPVRGNALRRLTTLACMISALTRSTRASLQSIGTHMEDSADLESRIKRAKRWLNNKWTDIDTHFVPYIIPIIRSLSKTGQLTLAIDGSTIGKDCMALMISIIWRRRAIPICWLVRSAPKGHFPQDMHVALINQVAQLIDSIIDCPCKVTLLGDGEFDGNDLQQACLGHDWDYVLKTSKNLLIADNPEMENKNRFDDLLPTLGTNHLFLPNMYITKQGYGLVNLVYWHDKRYQNPLYLLTNLEYAPMVKSFYRKRYLIETLFGDIKSRGFNIAKTKISTPLTITHLLIVACLAFIQAVLFEFEARRSRHLSRFCRKDRINDLSVFQLGFRGLIFYIKHNLPISFQFSKNFPDSFAFKSVR